MNANTFQSIKIDWIPTQSIAFSQNSISSIFTDGSRLDNLTEALVKGSVKIEEIDPIRVVKFNRRWISLDNRRLRVFRNAFIERIPVVICNLNEKKIEQEFWSKKTNKSLDGGGQIRERMEFSLNRFSNHFEQGIFAFNKKILNWTLQQIAKSSLFLPKPLPSCFDSKSDYYSSFLSLILEESRAVLLKGIEEANKNPFAYQLALAQFKPARNPSNPTEIRFNLLNDVPVEVKAGDILLLEYEGNPDLKLLALSNYAELDPSKPQLSFKVVVDEDLQIANESAFIGSGKHAIWNAKAVGSLITHQRMYEACTAYDEYESSVLEKCIRKGDLSRNCYQLLEESLPGDIEDVLSNLNISQRKAGEHFLRLTEGLQMIQGPPGTGKTSLLVTLLLALILHNRDLEEGEKGVAVSAPSNKAVQEIAERFIDKYPEIPVILIGAEDKLPADSPLSRIFVHTWGTEKISRLKQIIDDLWILQPVTIVEGDPRLLSDRVQNGCRRLTEIRADLDALLDDLMKYRLSFMQGLPTKEEFLSTIAAYNSFILSHNWENKEILTDSLLAEARILLSQISTKISSLQMELEGANNDESIRGLKLQLLINSKIVFGTLSVLGQQWIKLPPFNALLVDEAGQSCEAETLIPITRLKPKKCLLIGDPQQLPATIISPLAKDLNFNRSLMERLMERQQPFSRLTIQYRMHPEISSWPSRKFYQGELTDHESVTLRSPSMIANSPLLEPYSFFDVEGVAEKETNGFSYLNNNEANIAVRIVNYLHDQQKVDVIQRLGVITFYKAQADLIRYSLEKKFSGIKVSTVDGFQGGERDYIIVSFVRADKVSQTGSIGFLDDKRRLNVALTRAKQSLILLGHTKTLLNSEISELIEDAQNRKKLWPQDKLPVRLETAKPKRGIRADRNIGFSERKITVPKKGQPASKGSKKICRFYNGIPGSCLEGMKCSFVHTQ